MPERFVNQLFFGDNLGILREHVPDESVDLIYLDPPFNSKADYNVLFRNTSGEASAAQAIAFKDTWSWDAEASAAFHQIMTGPGIPTNLRNLMEALKRFLTGDTGQRGNSMMAYLTMMALRLVELHRVLKPTGSLYLHCDPTASHYLKMILDAVFGFQGFRSEISWKRTSAHSDGAQGRKQHGNIRDVIFFYTKGKDWIWNSIFTPYDESYRDTAYRLLDEQGRRYRRDNLTAARPGGDVSYLWPVKREGKNWEADLMDEYLNPKPGWEYKQVPPYKGRFWAYSKQNMRKFAEEGRLVYTERGMPEYKRYLDEMPGVPLQNSWHDITPAFGKESLGYPTQKPEALLERIILSSSNEGDLVLDPFCGCGTTIAVAERLGRRWIGIDITYLAVDLMERRLLDQFCGMMGVHVLSDVPVQKRRQALREYWSKGKSDLLPLLQPGLKPYEVKGDPKTAEDARALFHNDPYQFEWWAVAMVGAHGKERKKGADRGIDGIIIFQDKPGEYQRVLVSVKGGTLKREMIAALKGDMQREGAVIGILVTNESPTGPMKAEAAGAGHWSSKLHPSRSFPVIQMITAQELLSGIDPDIPRWGLDTHRRAAKAKSTTPTQPALEPEDGS